MEQKPDFSFHKSEPLCSKRIIDALFAGGSKSILPTSSGQGLVVAFLWLSDRLYASAEVDDCVRRLLVRISEQLPASPDEHTDDASTL